MRACEEFAFPYLLGISIKRPDLVGDWMIV